MVTVVEESQEVTDQLVLDTFGFEVLHQLKGQAWDERGLAVQAVRARVVQSDLGAVSPKAFFQAAQAVAMVALKDKVMPVFFDGLDLAKLLLGDFAVKLEPPLAKDTLGAVADQIIPVIVQKTSDRNARSIEATRQALVFLAKQAGVGCAQVMSHILAPIANGKDYAAIRGRLELIECFVKEFGFDKKNAGLSLGAVMTFVRTHLEAADEKVRRAAVEVTVQCYGLKGDRTMKYCSNLKPALLKLLESRFNEVDGKQSKKTPSKRKSGGGGVPRRRPLERNSAFSGGSAPDIATAPKKPLGPLAPLARVSSREAEKRSSGLGGGDDLDELLGNDTEAPSSLKPLGGLSSLGGGGVRDPITLEPIEANPHFIPSPTKAEVEDDIDGLMNEIDDM